MDDKQIECGGFTFLSNFDSANLSRVELVPRKPVPPEPSAKSNKKVMIKSVNRYLPKKQKTIEYPDYEFNIWTNPDCVGTEFENCNRTWFHFGITGGTVFSLVKLNIIDLNKQSKMYSQGMAPVFKIVPGKCQWERIRDKPIFTSENNVFTISFKFRTTENVRAITYFAFTYPFSYLELQHYLGNIDDKMSKQENHLPKSEIRFNKGLKIVNDINDAVYYHRETICYSLENRKIDLLTISSHHNITAERETRLQKLFPDESTPRPFKFQDKKVIFISARVHPGETPSSFVMNGIINLLIQKDDPIAILLRRQFLFKLIPMLNPDGVARGHYRTDTRGCNLNRYYLNPSREFHPSIFGARSLIRYHHFGAEVEEDIKLEKFDVSSQVDPNELTESDFSSPGPESQDISGICNLEMTESVPEKVPATNSTIDMPPAETNCNDQINSKSSTEISVKNMSMKRSNELLSEQDEVPNVDNSEEEVCLDKDEAKRLQVQNESGKSTARAKRIQESGLFLYLDMHGHASKKGVFMYGNHFDKIEDSVECMDKRDGTSREGSGRVAVLRLTGLIRSYTLECNYNTGRFVNKLPQCSRDLPGKNNTNLLVPPKYSPGVYEEIGRSLCVSFLDLTNSNPWSRIPNSEYHTIFGIRDWLRLKTISESFLYHRPLGRSLLRSKQPNKSSQTQVEDFNVLNYEVGKKLKNVQAIEVASNLSETVIDETDEFLSEYESSSNEEPEKTQTEVSALRRSLNEAGNFLSYRTPPKGSRGSPRVASSRQRAVRLLNRPDICTIFDTCKSEEDTQQREYPESESTNEANNNDTSLRDENVIGRKESSLEERCTIM
ncbi:hypothetical protein RUM43_003418 [Polyplax serrata]|uniref:tubulin-glutamate carboxypeptidase n=1 Tax=Polyplax serrata TaxID=468196 RepID=A0AAN8S9E0_POLSC